MLLKYSSTHNDRHTDTFHYREENVTVDHHIPSWERMAMWSGPNAFPKGCPQLWALGTQKSEN